MELSNPTIEMIREEFNKFSKTYPKEVAIGLTIKEFSGLEPELIRGVLKDTSNDLDLGFI